MNHKTSLALAVLLLLGTAVHAPAADAAKEPKPSAKPASATSASNPAAEPKSASDVFDRFAKATGGETLAKIKTRSTKGAFEMPAMNLQAEMDVFVRSADGYYSISKMDAGTFERGYDGKVGWAKDPFGGLRELEGTELADVRRDANLQMPIEMAKLFPEAKLKGKEKIEAGETWVIEAPGTNKPQKLYFHADSGLLARWERDGTSPNGPISVVADFKDYREVDGIKLAYFVTYSMGEFQFGIRIAEVKHGVEVPAPKFAKPSE